MNHCIEATEAINSLRSLLGWHPGQRVTGAISLRGGTLDDTWRWTKYALVLGKLDGVRNIQEPAHGIVLITLPWANIGIPVPPDFDYARTREKLKKDLAEASKHAAQHEARLNDPMFMQKADAETIENVGTRLQELKTQTTVLERQIKQLDAAVV
jgi:valyl-tRNA synthetase